MVGLVKALGPPYGYGLPVFEKALAPKQTEACTPTMSKSVRLDLFGPALLFRVVKVA
jgi:hypothetical protein